MVLVTLHANAVIACMEVEIAHTVDATACTEDVATHMQDEIVHIAVAMSYTPHAIAFIAPAKYS